MQSERKSGFSRVVTIFMEYFGLSWALSLLVVSFISLINCLAVYWFIWDFPYGLMPTNGVGGFRDFLPSS